MDKLKLTNNSKMRIKEKKIPLSRKAKAKIIQYINKNKLKGDERLPSEAELMKMLGVSRYTVREALALLEQERWIYRVQGKGTYVSEGPNIEIQAGLEKLDSITEIIKKFGHVPDTKWISIKEISPSEDMVDKLKIKKEDKVVRFERIRMADDKPSAYLIDTVPKKILNNIVPKKIEGESLFKYLKKSFGIGVEYASANIIPVLPSEDMKKYLKVKGDLPFLLLHQVHYDEHDKPVFYSFDYFDPQVFKFKVNRRR
ncbi:MAG: GntR family transcriptional regulator [Tissierella sp.]